MEHIVRGGKPVEELRDAETVHGAQIAKRAKGKAGGRSAGLYDDPYGILGVRRGASAGEIRAAYLRLVKELHPDGRATDPQTDDGDERLKAINEAYRELKGLGGRASGRRAERRTWARRASSLFLVGVLSSSMPLAALAVAAYYAGWLGPREAPSETAAIEEGGRSPANAASEHAKESSVRRQTALAEAERRGTKRAWEQLIASYPDGGLAARARQAIAAIERAEARKKAEHTAWIAAEKGGTKEDLEGFVAAYPDAENAARARQAIAAIERAEARKKAEHTAWIAAKKGGTKEDIEGFVTAYPASEHAVEAKQALAAIAAAHALVETDLAAWAEAKRDGGKAALRRYLADFPSGRNAGEARKRVALLEAAEKDDAAWGTARRHNSKEAYARYLAAHPDGRRAADARVRIADLERGEARTAQVKAPPAKPRAPVAIAGQGWPPAADAPFIGADGRIRR